MNEPKEAVVVMLSDQAKAQDPVEIADVIDRILDIDTGIVLNVDDPVLLSKLVCELQENRDLWYGEKGINTDQPAKVVASLQI